MSAFAIVPRPGRTPSGNHRPSTSSELITLTVPRLRPIWSEMPWWKTVHGSRPRSACTSNASARPKRTSPESRRIDRCTGRSQTPFTPRPTPPLSRTGRRAWAWTAKLLRVERLELLRVELVDHVALDLQRRRQLTSLLREVVVEDEEALDLLNARVVLVDPVQLALDQLDVLRFLVQGGEVLRETVLASEVD